MSYYTPRVDFKITRAKTILDGLSCTEHCMMRISEGVPASQARKSTEHCVKRARECARA